MDGILRSHVTNDNPLRSLRRKARRSRVPPMRFTSPGALYVVAGCVIVSKKTHEG